MEEKVSPIKLPAFVSIKFHFFIVKADSIERNRMKKKRSRLPTKASEFVAVVDEPSNNDR